MKFDVEDTIAAIASARGSSLRGIIRISGRQAIARIIDSFPIERLQADFAERDKALVPGIGRRSTAHFRKWITELTSAEFCWCSIQLEPEIEVDANVLVWPDSRSFTRQPAVEIHTVGSLPVLQMILDRLVASGCRLAEPGEYTMRAFLAGRIDLTQAEAVMGVVDARNQQQFARALTQLAGGIGTPITSIRDQLLGLLAELEAGLDFADEDIEFISAHELQRQLTLIAEQLDSITNQICNRQTVNERVKAVLIGRPNVGKSSLFNALSCAAAIVSQIEGTTRDYLTAVLEVDGVSIELVDTAGIDDLSSVGDGYGSMIELMKHQTRTQFQDADICILCMEPGNGSYRFENELMQLVDRPIVRVLTKSDLNRHPTGALPAVLFTSAIERQGIDELKSEIHALARSIRDSESALTTTMARSTQALDDATQSIGLARQAVAAGLGEEVVAVELRTALDQLGRVVGSIYTDDILDLVFSRFCIGK